MDTEAELLAAILSRPGDATAWLAYADWLDDRGRGPEADRIRLAQTSMLYAGLSYRWEARLYPTAEFDYCSRLARFRVSEKPQSHDFDLYLWTGLEWSPPGPGVVFGPVTLDIEGAMRLTIPRATYTCHEVVIGVDRFNLQARPSGEPVIEYIGG